MSLVPLQLAVVEVTQGTRDSVVLETQGTDIALKCCMHSLTQSTHMYNKHIVSLLH